MAKRLLRLGTIFGVFVLVTAGISIVNPQQASAVTHFYNTPGDVGTVTVPEGVTEVTLRVRGGDGASGPGQCSGLGGTGGYAVGVLQVEPGDVLSYVVGADGQVDGRSGGNGGNPDGGAGGSASFVYLNGTGIHDVVIAAGGGGGGGSAPESETCSSVYGGDGGDAGTIATGEGADGEDGFDNWDVPRGGGGGIPELEGGGGIFMPADNGYPGSELNGGNGGDSMGESGGGGGGGGGYFGGGGGASTNSVGAGGGAGASYLGLDLTDGSIDAFMGTGPHVSIEYEASTTTTTATTAPATSPTTAPTLTPPNDGDGNGDGIEDSLQNNVVSFIDSTSGKYITVVSPEGTQLSAVSSSPESEQAAQDEDYDYAFGLTRFTVSGIEPGQTIEMNFYFHSDLDADLFVARKLIGSNYSTLEGASITNVNVGASSKAIKLTYGIADNGELDTNSELGVITDPVGLGNISGALPATGSRGLSTQLWVAFVLLLAGGGLALRRRGQVLQYAE